MEIRFAGRMSGVDDSAVREILALTASHDIISFSGGNPPEEAFPVREIAALAAEGLAQHPADVLQYGATAGYAPLLDALSTRMAARFGARLAAENTVFTTTGSQQAADLLAHVLLNEGDVALVEEPSFVGYLNSFRAYGARLVGIPMEPDGMDVEALAAALRAEPRAKLLYTISNFQNPTGFTTSAEKRAAIYRLAQAHDLVILEDDAYGELRFRARPCRRSSSWIRTGAWSMRRAFPRCLRRRSGWAMPLHRRCWPSGCWRPSSARMYTRPRCSSISHTGL